MALTAFNVLVVLALVFTVIAGVTGKVPLFVPVLLLGIALLVGSLMTLTSFVAGWVWASIRFRAPAVR